MVRCGACRTQFDVPGAGRFACPVCGSVNVVRGGAAPDPRAAGQPGPSPTPPPPRPPDPPSPRIDCPECGFRFIVGQIAKARCPNCGFEVEIEQPGPAEAPANG
jgi:LSD1 subclass zinc finger protein